MKITAVDVRAFKRIEHVHIEPGGDRHLLLIAGNNGNGKSSLLDALTAAFGGSATLPPDPIHHGERGALIVVELGGERGRYTIKRTITPTGTKLEINGPDGAIRSPQTWLDKLVGSRFLDPLEFLGKSAKDQRALLLQVAGVDVTGVDAERKRAFDERTQVGRDLDKAEGELARLPEPGPAPGEARPMADILRDREAASLRQRDIGEVRRGLEHARRQRADAEEQVGRLRALLEEALLKLEGATASELEWQRAVQDRGTLEHESAARAQVEALDEEAKRAETFARWQAGARQIRIRIDEAKNAVRELSDRKGALTEAIADCDRRKAAALAAAPMPVTGLAVTDDGIQLGGVPFEQASQSERLRCALAIAMRLSPNVRDVWVRDGSLLDDHALDVLRALAEENDCRVWVERVGERDAGAVVIRDGRVFEPE